MIFLKYFRFKIINGHAIVGEKITHPLKQKVHNTTHETPGTFYHLQYKLSPTNYFKQ